MAGKSPNVQLLGETLTRQYRLACELYNTYPVGRNTHQLSQGNLCIDLAAIDHDHLEAICHILQNKTTPLALKVSIPPLKEVGARIIQQAVRGISLCLAQSLTLTTLELCNIVLKGNNLDVLCQGFSKSRNIKVLNITSCSLRDAGVERLCQNIKNVPSISNLSLIDCCISEKGAEMVAGLLKHQRLNRDSAMWQDTLRLRHPHLDGMRGLRRITLNNNPKFGDTGANALAEVLSEDLWIKAVDLQHCGIGCEGGLALKKVLKTNHTIEVMDLRKNPFVLSQIVNEVINNLYDRRDEYNVNQYAWLDSDSDQKFNRGKEMKQDNSRKYASTVKEVVKEKVHEHPQERQTPSRKTPSVPDKSGIPWRVEHRLYERREGLKPGSAVVDSFVESTKSTPELDENSDIPIQKLSKHLRKLKKVLSHYKHLYRKEKGARRHAEQKLSNLRAKMTEGHMMDERTVSHIETCFQKFQAFLMNLKTAGFHWHAGLWEAMCEDIGPLNDKQPEITSLLHHPIVNPLESEKTVGIPNNYEELLSSSNRNLHVSRNGGSSDIYHDENVPNRGRDAVDSIRVSGIPWQSTYKEMKQNNENIIHQIDGEAIKKLCEDIDVGRNLLLSYTTSGAGYERDNVHYSRNTITDPDAVMASNLHIYDKSNCTEKRGGNREEIKLKGIEDVDIKCIDSPIKEQYERNSLQAETEDVRSRENNKGVKIQKECVETENVSQKHLRETYVIKDSDKDVWNADEKLHAVNSESKSSQNHTPNHLSTTDRDSMKSEHKLQNHSYDNSGLRKQSNIENRNEREEASMKYAEVKLIQAENMEKKASSKAENKLRETDKIERNIATPKEGVDSEVADTASYSQRSETDDEKLQMKKTYVRQAARSGSISSVSITEHLNHSHSSWTHLGNPKLDNHANLSGSKTSAAKLKKTKTNIIETLNSKEMESSVPVISRRDKQMDYDSDFEVSDVEGLSISASSLTSTTIPDDLVTPGEEEF